MAEPKGFPHHLPRKLKVFLKIDIYIVITSRTLNCNSFAAFKDKTSISIEHTDLGRA